MIPSTTSIGKQLISILPLGRRIDVHSNQNKTEANFRFTYDIDFHVQLVRLLLVFLVACTRFWCGWKVQVSISRRRCLIEWSFWERNASMLARWWLFSWVSSCLRLTTLVTRCWSLFTLLQMAASICRLVACLTEWKKEHFLIIRNKLWISLGRKEWTKVYVILICLFHMCMYPHPNAHNLPLATWWTNSFFLQQATLIFMSTMLKNTSRWTLIQIFLCDSSIWADDAFSTEP